MENKATRKVKRIGQGIDKKIDSVKKSPNTKWYLLLGVLGVIIVYKVVNSVTGAVDTIFSGDQNIDDSVPVGNLPGSSATITQQQAAMFAQQLLDAMNAKQPFWGTDEATILAVFKKFKNGDDFRLVFNAFGMKDYNGYNSPPTGIWSNLDSYEKRNLVYWLKSELSPSDGEVYSLVKKYVELAGFAF